MIRSIIWTDAPPLSVEPTRWAWPRHQRPNPCYRASIAQTLVGPLDAMCTEEKCPTDGINRASLALSGGGPIRCSRQQRQGSAPCYQVSLAQTLVGLLDALGIDTKRQIDGIDRGSCTFWWACTNRLALMPRARCMLWSKPCPSPGRPT